MSLLRPPRPTSPARAAAARANGAKSRGPVTARGKSISSRNSLRHGLRSRGPLFADPGSVAELAATLDAFENDFKPADAVERALVKDMAVASWHSACLFKLELAAFDCAEFALKASAENCPAQLPVSNEFWASAVRLNARFERQQRRALEAFAAHRAASSANLNLRQQTPQISENSDSEPAGNPARILDPNAQIVENPWIEVAETPPPGLPALSTSRLPSWSDWIIESSGEEL